VQQNLGQGAQEGWVEAHSGDLLEIVLARGRTGRDC
jgi:hypothetical protein